MLPLLVLSGCVTAPWPGAVSVPGNPIGFQGANLDSGRTVRVEAFNPSTLVWDEITTIDGATAPTPGIFVDSDLYLWWDEVSVPPEYWTPDNACAGQTLTVRTLDHGWNVPLQVPLHDGGACLAANPKIGMYAMNCIDEATPEVVLTTEDYVAVPPVAEYSGPYLHIADPCIDPIAFYDLPDGSDYTGGQVRMRMETEEVVMSCTFDASTHRVSCPIPAYGPAVYANRNHIQLSLRVLDPFSCPNGPAWTDWTPWENASATGSGGIENPGACQTVNSIPDPPEGSDDGVWTDLVCSCSAEVPGGPTGHVSLEACIDESIGYDADVLCDNVALRLEVARSVPMSCSVEGTPVTTGPTGCFPGDMKMVSMTRTP